MRSIVLLFLLAGSLFILAACSSEQSAELETATPATVASSEQRMGGGMMGMGGNMMARHHAPVPSGYIGLGSPVVSDESSIARGGEIYITNCASCHGDGGMGDGSAAAGLDPAPAPIAHTSQMLGDDYLYWRISEGGAMAPFDSSMVAWKDILTEEERWDVINYVRALGAGKIQPLQGMSGTTYNPDAEAEKQAQMLAAAVELGLISQEESALFADAHPLVDGWMIQNREREISGMDDRMAAALAELVETGELSQSQADIFASVHNRLAEAGLMP